MEFCRIFGRQLTELRAETGGEIGQAFEPHFVSDFRHAAKVLAQQYGGALCRRMKFDELKELG